MNKKLLIVLLLPFFFFIVANPVEAHFLATDKNIGAILHVDPNDDPIAGSQASFFFEFKDKENKFKPQNCDCTFEIYENGNNIYSQPLFQNSTNPSLNNANVFYTFPQEDVYQIQIVGKPVTPNEFQPFTLHWYFRVDQQATNQTSSGQTNTNFFTQHLVHFLGIGIFILLFLCYIIYQKLHKKNQTMKGGEKKDDEKDTRNIY